ncbi:DUF2789 domain-containing protein [Pontibacter sp. JAM-7]|uniref:DUF2789 domain-containing protein n=1 Tax=Pontibacter sp. JAM-7 TaxID=3366581 RepID=UPI003AF4EA67
MYTSEHTFSALFQQLGLPSQHGEITSFIQAHRSLDPHTTLADAPFWSDSQSAFLREAISDDSDWAEVVDELDAQLRN